MTYESHASYTDTYIYAMADAIKYYINIFNIYAECV